MLLFPLLVIFLSSMTSLIDGHTYHMGGECAQVESMSGFNMDKFLGKWYAIQKTSSANRCYMYNFERTEFRRKYRLQQVSESPVIGLVKDNTYKYTGNLEFADEEKQAEMTVQFPLNFIGKSSFIVFATDYDNYAGIYTCQKMGFTRRESATILSRQPTLSKAYLDKVRNRLSAFNVNPFDMNIIDHKNCTSTEDKFTIDITDTTFDKENVGKTFKKVASAVSNGVDFLVKGAKDVYNSVMDKDQEKERLKDREETTNGYHTYVEPSAEML